LKIFLAEPSRTWSSAGEGFLENFLQTRFSKILIHAAFYRKFQGLSKLLPKLDLATRLHRKKSKIKWFYNFGQHCIITTYDFVK
jgi:hypothetical protein